MDIAKLSAGGGTNILPGLREAKEILDSINAKVKHVILMTDGEAPTDGIADLVGQMRDERITVSCVGVQGADKNLLSMIADTGEGRLYMVEDIGALPKIFMKETQEAREEPARRGPRPRADREAGRGDRGHRASRTRRRCTATSRPSRSRRRRRS